MTDHEFRSLSVLDRVEMRAMLRSASGVAEVWRPAVVEHTDHFHAVTIWFTDPVSPGGEHLAVSVGQCAELRHAGVHIVGGAPLEFPIKEVEPVPGKDTSAAFAAFTVAQSDDAKPAHPPPWRWVAPDVGEPDRGFLVDANGARVLSIAIGHDPGDETILPASPVVRSLTELAPELEAAVRRRLFEYENCVLAADRGMRVLAEDAAHARRVLEILARLDEARKASR